MKSQWYSFIEEYESSIPFKPLSVILEAFYWYIQQHSNSTTDHIFETMAGNKVNDLMS